MKACLQQYAFQVLGRAALILLERIMPEEARVRKSQGKTARRKGS